MGRSLFLCLTLARGISFQLRLKGQHTFFSNKGHNSRPSETEREELLSCLPQESASFQVRDQIEMGKLCKLPWHLAPSFHGPCATPRLFPGGWWDYLRALPDSPPSHKGCWQLQRGQPPAQMLKSSPRPSETTDSSQKLSLQPSSSLGGRLAVSQGLKGPALREDQVPYNSWQLCSQKGPGACDRLGQGRKLEGTPCKSHPKPSTAQSGPQPSSPSLPS